MSRDFVLKESDYLMLKRELGHLRREYSNLKNSLASYGLRRHEGGYIPGDTFKWFSLSETLSEFGDAEAYDCTFNESTDLWEEDATSGLTTLYSTAEGVTGSDGDIVLARYIRPLRQWEVLSKPAGSRLITFWYGGATKDESLSGSHWSQSDDATIYFNTRIGAADNGVTHDPSEAAPKTNGNFTVTTAGLYQVSMWVRLKPDGTTFGAASTGEGAWFRIALRNDPADGGATSFVPGSDMEGDFAEATEYLASGNGFMTRSTTFLTNLELNDKLHILCQSNSNPASLEWELNNASISFERIGSIIEAATIP